MRPIIAVTALLTIIDGSCGVSVENKIARYNVKSRREYNIRCLTHR